jgi:hypothetical protein
MFSHNDRSDIPAPGRHPATIASTRALRSIRFAQDPVGYDTQGRRF